MLAGLARQIGQLAADQRPHGAIQLFYRGAAMIFLCDQAAAHREWHPAQEYRPAPVCMTCAPMLRPTVI